MRWGRNGWVICENIAILDVHRTDTDRSQRVYSISIGAAEEASPLHDSRLSRTWRRRAFAHNGDGTRRRQRWLRLHETLGESCWCVWWWRCERKERDGCDGPPSDFDLDSISVCIGAMHRVGSRRVGRGLELSAAALLAFALVAVFFVVVRRALILVDERRLVVRRRRWRTSETPVIQHEARARRQVVRIGWRCRPKSCTKRSIFRQKYGIIFSTVPA